MGGGGEEGVDEGVGVVVDGFCEGGACSEGDMRQLKVIRRDEENFERTGVGWKN